MCSYRTVITFKIELEMLKWRVEPSNDVSLPRGGLLTYDLRTTRLDIMKSKEGGDFLICTYLRGSLVVSLAAVKTRDIHNYEIPVQQTHCIKPLDLPLRFNFSYKVQETYFMASYPCITFHYRSRSLPLWCPSTC